MDSHSNWQKKKILASRAHQEKIYQFLNNQNYIKRVQKKITLEDNKEYIEFISCSYLGLDQHPNVVNCVANNINDIGLSFLSSRTRMKYKGLDIFEDILNQIFSAHTVVFSTTHLAHLGLISLIASGEMPSVKLATYGCSFLLDKHVHASIQINRGLMQQFGNVELVDFQDISLLKKKMYDIHLQSKTPLLFSDSIGSMGGIMPITELLELTNQYAGYLYLDDAHGMSVYGQRGAGYAMEVFRALPERVILTTSLGKGFGTCGGVMVLPTYKDVEFVKTYCQIYIFSGTLVNPLIHACIESGKIHLSSEIYWLQNELHKKIALFDSLIVDQSKVVNFGCKTPIRGIIIGNEFAAIEKGVFLKEQGYLVVVATYPIREKGQAILRLLISASHTVMEIENVCKIINSILETSI